MRDKDIILFVAFEVEKMKWSTHQLKKLQHKGLTLDEVIELSSLKEINHEIREVSPVHVRGRMDYSAEKITFQLHLTGTLILPCSRSLVDVEFPFDIQTTETFYTSSNEMIDGADDYHLLAGDVLDLIPVIEDNILTEIPIQIFSDKPVTEEMSQGQGWEVIAETEVKEKLDPRLAELAKFFDKDKE